MGEVIQFPHKNVVQFPRHDSPASAPELETPADIIPFPDDARYDALRDIIKSETTGVIEKALEEGASVINATPEQLATLDGHLAELHRHPLGVPKHIVMSVTDFMHETTVDPATLSEYQYIKGCLVDTIYACPQNHPSDKARRARAVILLAQTPGTHTGMPTDPA